MLDGSVGSFWTPSGTFEELSSHQALSPLSTREKPRLPSSATGMTSTPSGTLLGSSLIHQARSPDCWCRSRLAFRVVDLKLLDVLLFLLRLVVVVVVVGCGDVVAWGCCCCCSTSLGMLSLASSHQARSPESWRQILNLNLPVNHHFHPLQFCNIFLHVYKVG